MSNPTYQGNGNVCPLTFPSTSFQSSQSPEDKNGVALSTGHTVSFTGTVIAMNTLDALGQPIPAQASILVSGGLGLIVFVMLEEAIGATPTIDGVIQGFLPDNPNMLILSVSGSAQNVQIPSYFTTFVS
jgi:hypothetical protein